MRFHSKMDVHMLSHSRRTAKAFSTCFAAQLLLIIWGMNSIVMLAQVLVCVEHLSTVLTREAWECVQFHVILKLVAAQQSARALFALENVFDKIFNAVHKGEVNIQLNLL